MRILLTNDDGIHAEGLSVLNGSPDDIGRRLGSGGAWVATRAGLLIL